MRTIPGISELLKPLDEAIDNFIKILLQGYTFNIDERLLFSLPAKFGGLGIPIPSQVSDSEYNNSVTVTKEITAKVIKQEQLYVDCSKDTGEIKNKIKSTKEQRHNEDLKRIINNTTCKRKVKALEATNENGASIWLTVKPIQRNGFFLEKQAFWDALRIRYAIPLERLPTTCVCGVPFDVQHSFSCPKGGLTIHRHNEIRDITSEILKEVCPNVVTEPMLTPLTGEQLQYATSKKADNARADVSAKDFWIKGQVAYCDVRVFNPIAKCHLNQSLSSVHRRNEAEKKRQYNQPILQVEHGSFTPLVFSCFGGMSRECSRFFSQAADHLASKRNLSKSSTSSWIKARLNFALLRSCLLCIRGSRTAGNITSLDESDLNVIIQDSCLSDD